MLLLQVVVDRIRDNVIVGAVLFELAHDPAFDDLKVDFGSVNFLLKLRGVLHLPHQLLVGGQRHVGLCDGLRGSRKWIVVVWGGRGGEEL